MAGVRRELERRGAGAAADLEHRIVGAEVGADAGEGFFVGVHVLDGTGGIGFRDIVPESDFGGHVGLRSVFHLRVVPGLTHAEMRIELAKSVFELYRNA